MPRTINIARVLDSNVYQVFEQPELELFSYDPGSSRFHLMLRQMQRDEGIISDKEMAIAERVVSGTIACSPHKIRYNPFTGAYNEEGLF